MAFKILIIRIEQIIHWRDRMKMENAKKNTCEIFLKALIIQLSVHILAALVSHNSIIKQILQIHKYCIFFINPFMLYSHKFDHVI